MVFAIVVVVVVVVIVDIVLLRYYAHTIDRSIDRLTDYSIYGSVDVYRRTEPT